MSRCYVSTCGNYYGKTRGQKKVIYHKFPSDRKLALKWIRACGRGDQQIPYYSRVCSEHFSSYCYKRDLQHEIMGLPLRKQLISGAVPDVNLPKTITEKPKTPTNKVPNSVVVIKQKPTTVPVIKKAPQSSVKLKAQIDNPEPINNKLDTIKSNDKPLLSDIKQADGNNLKQSKRASTQPLKDYNEQNPRTSSLQHDLATKDERSQCSKEKLKRTPLRSSYRIAKQKFREALSDSLTAAVNRKVHTSSGPRGFSDQLSFMAKLQLKYEINKSPCQIYDLQRSWRRLKEEKCFTKNEGSYERDVQHEILGLPTRSRLKRGALPDQNLPNDFLNEEKQPESAIDILLAVGLVPTNKTSGTNGGLPEDLSKMQIMEDVREGCDTNPPSSPGHAEQGEDSGLKEVKKDATLGNGLLKAEIKSEMEISEVVTHELYEKRSNDEVNDKQEENSSNHSLSSENNEKRKLEPDNSSIKRRKTEIEDSFTARDKIIVEFMELAECNNLEQVQNLSDQIFSEIKALNELAREKEKEWNQLLHMKKLKEELLIRLQRKRQVLIINDSDLNEFQPETNGQQSLLKCNQKVNMLRELRAANIEKLKQRNMLQTASKQKPMLDVQSIIADYRQRHPESVPRRGGSLTIGQSAGMDNHESGLSGSLNGSQDDSRSSLLNSWCRQGDEIKSYKDVLLQFAKLSQSEKSELQTQMQNLKPPPPYPEVTVHPVTSTSSVTPTNSLLHGILTKAPVKQSHSNGNNHTAMNGKSTFSPTLARLLTAPEKAAIQSSTPNMLGGSLLNASNMSISDIFSGGKVRNEITITPLGGQFETPAKRELIDEDEQADRLVIDEALDNSGSRIKEDNRSDDGEEVPQCQGCNQQAAQFVCAGCGNQWYCSRDCQVAAWDDHSELCSG